MLGHIGTCPTEDTGKERMGKGGGLNGRLCECLSAKDLIGIRSQGTESDDFTCSIWLVNHGLYYSSSGINEPGKRQDRRERTDTLNHLPLKETNIHYRAQSRQSHLHDFMAALATSCSKSNQNRETTTKERLFSGLGAQSGILLMSLMMYSFSLIKLLITFGNYGYSKDIPQALHVVVVRPLCIWHSGAPRVAPSHRSFRAHKR